MPQHPAAPPGAASSGGLDIAWDESSSGTPKVTDGIAERVEERRGSGVARAARSFGLPAQVIVALLAGVLLGILSPRVGASCKPLAAAFISAVKMVVIPLVFCAAASGTMKIALESRQLGRMAVVALLWFILAGLTAIALGLALDAVFHPGVGVFPAESHAPSPRTGSTVDFTQTLLDAIPSNIVAAMAQQKVLPTLVFAVLFGLGLGSLGAARAKPMADVFDTVLAVMFRITRWVVALAPVAVFATVASLLGTQSGATIWALGKLLVVVYLGYLLFGLLCVGGFALLCAHPLRLARQMIAPALLGLVTRSSEAALPLHMEKLEEAGFANRIVSVVLPLGYSFNLDGAALYLGLATPFIAETHGLHLSLAQRLTVLATGLLASKGVANVPSGSLVALSTVVLALGLPPESLALIAGVDVFLDMGRTALNVFGNTLSVLVVDRSRSGSQSPSAASGGRRP